MNVRKTLHEAYRLEQLIASHRSELAAIRETYGVIGGGSGAAAPRWNGDTSDQGKAIRAADLDMQIQQELAAMEQALADAHALIEHIENPTARLICRDFYIHGWTIREIADDLHYSPFYVKRLKLDAVTALSAKYDTE